MRKPSLELLKRFKSPWFYWHTGHKRIALLSMAASAAVMVTVFVVAAGFSVWGAIIAVLLDAVGFGLAVLYLLVLRSHVPDFFGFQANADSFVVNQLVVPMLVGFFINRLLSFLVAKACGYTPPPPKNTSEPRA